LFLFLMGDMADRTLGASQIGAAPNVG
jgi:hypothetical protein